MRDQVVLATKGRFPMGDGPNDVGCRGGTFAGPGGVAGAARRRPHRPLSAARVGSGTPLEETLRFLDDAVRAGKIGYVGLSNFTGWQLQKAV